MASHTRKVEMPKTKREGLANAIQLAINALDAGDTREAMLQMENILDDVSGESNPYNVDPQAKTPKAKRAPAKQKRRGKVPAPRFQKGDRVKIAPHCVPYEGVYKPGDEATVRKVFWDEGGGGQDAGWVCEVDMGRPEVGYRRFWESLLEPA